MSNKITRDVLTLCNTHLNAADQRTAKNHLLL